MEWLCVWHLCWLYVRTKNPLARVVPRGMCRRHTSVRSAAVDVRPGGIAATRWRYAGTVQHAHGSVYRRLDVHPVWLGLCLVGRICVRHVRWLYVRTTNPLARVVPRGVRGHNGPRMSIAAVDDRPSRVAATRWWYAGTVQHADGSVYG